MRAIRRILPIAAMLPVALASAHHSAGALYFVDRTIVVEGIVKEYKFVNPHVRLYIEVVADSGSAEIWLAEGQSKNVLAREGWTGQELEAGDRVTLTGNPPRDGSRSIQWSSIDFTDGRSLGGGTIKDFSAHIERLRRR